MDFLVTEKWHKPYAEALLETDPAKVLTLISEAEHEILTRFFEFHQSPGSKEQSLDLRRAVDTLVHSEGATCLAMCCKGSLPDGPLPLIVNALPPVF
jgi:hypothetical protein